MGRVRDLHYDAVIGVGGIGPWPRREGIAAKVTWVGAESSKVQKLGLRGPVVIFKKFVRFEDQGILLGSVVPALARRIYEKRVRYVLLRTGKEHKEAEALLRSLLSARNPPSKRVRPTRLPPLRCGSHAA